MIPLNQIHAWFCFKTYSIVYQWCGLITVHSNKIRICFYAISRSKKVLIYDGYFLFLMVEYEMKKKETCLDVSVKYKYCYFYLSCSMIQNKLFEHLSSHFHHQIQDFAVLHNEKRIYRVVFACFEMILNISEHKLLFNCVYVFFFFSIFRHNFWIFNISITTFIWSNYSANTYLYVAG